MNDINNNVQFDAFGLGDLSQNIDLSNITIHQSHPDLLMEKNIFSRLMKIGLSAIMLLRPKRYG